MINPFIFIQKEKIKKRRQKLKKMRPIIIMARGHSGTRVLAWILNHLNVKMWSDQNRASGDTDSKLNKKIKFIAKRNPFITETCKYKNYLRIILEDAIYNYYNRLGKPSGNWGWKFPETYLMAPLISDIFPQARFIHMVRDGRDLAFKEHLTDDPHRKVGRKILNRLNALDKSHHIQAALSWKYQINSFNDFKHEKLNKAQVFELKFEDLIKRPLAKTRELCDFCKLSLTEQAIDYLNKEIIRDKVKQHKEKPFSRIKQVEVKIYKSLKLYNYELYSTID